MYGSRLWRNGQTVSTKILQVSWKSHQMPSKIIWYENVHHATLHTWYNRFLSARASNFILEFQSFGFLIYFENSLKSLFEGFFWKMFTQILSLKSFSNLKTKKNTFNYSSLGLTRFDLCLIFSNISVLNFFALRTLIFAFFIALLELFLGLRFYLALFFPRFFHLCVSCFPPCLGFFF